MNTSVASSPYFRLFQAAQIKLNDRGFLSRDITVRELIEVKSDVHHVFPRDYLKKSGLERGKKSELERGQYNRSQTMWWPRARSTSRSVTNRHKRTSHNF